MNSMQCDVCGRNVTAGENGREYFHVAEMDLCEDCLEQVELSVRPVIRTKQPFSFEWYGRLMKDAIEKAITKAK